jgi:hypothetical protein
MRVILLLLRKHRLTYLIIKRYGRASVYEVSMGGSLFLYSIGGGLDLYVND